MYSVYLMTVGSYVYVLKRKYGRSLGFYSGTRPRSFFLLFVMSMSQSARRLALSGAQRPDISRHACSTVKNVYLRTHKEACPCYNNWKTGKCP